MRAWAINGIAISVIFVEKLTQHRILARNLTTFFSDVLVSLKFFFSSFHTIIIIAANSNRLKVLYFHYEVHEQSASIGREKMCAQIFGIRFWVWCPFLFFSSRSHRLHISLEELGITQMLDKTWACDWSDIVVLCIVHVTRTNATILYYSHWH